MPKSDQYDETVANGPLHAAAEIKALKMKVAALEKEKDLGKEFNLLLQAKVGRLEQENAELRTMVATMSEAITHTQVWLDEREASMSEKSLRKILSGAQDKATYREWWKDVGEIIDENESLKAALKDAKCGGCRGQGCTNAANWFHKGDEPIQCEPCGGSGSAYDVWLKSGGG